MKIIAACTLIGKGDMLFTDQPFTARLSRQASGKRHLLFTDQARTVELDINEAGRARKTDGDVLSFLVPEMDDRTRSFVVGRDFELK